MKTSIELIAEERQRQIESLGYHSGYLANQTEDYGCEQLAIAAATYALPSEKRNVGNDKSFVPTPESWPWPSEYWNPSPENRILELTKARALIAAEIDRLKALENYQDHTCKQSDFETCVSNFESKGYSFVGEKKDREVIDGETVLFLTFIK